MSSQRERSFLPAFRPERIHNLVKSAPNLDNKSSTSTSTDNIVIGNSAEFCDRMAVKSSTASVNNSHEYTNTNYHSIYYERDLTKNGIDNEKKIISEAPINLHNHSHESIEYDTDESGHSVSASVGCFSFVGGGNNTSNESKKAKSRYKKLPKVHPSDLENRQLLSSITDSRKSSRGSNSRKNSTDPKKKLQFEELSTPANTRVDVDLLFYKRLEQSLDAVGSRELTEQDNVYLRAKLNKNKLAIRLQQSLDAIDSYDLDDSDQSVRTEKVYSKSIDDLSTDDYHWQRGGSQFTWECFLKNGSARNGYSEKRNNKNNNRDSESSHESTSRRKSSWPVQY